MSNSDNSLSQEDQTETVRIRDSKAGRERDFKRQEFFEASRGSQEDRAARIFDAAVDDLANFVRRTMGVSYNPKNNFSFTQKQKIMGYMYFKNNVDLQKSRMFTYLDVKAGNSKASIQTRIDHLNEMKDYNRAYFIYNLAQCQNRLRMVGHIWGAVISAVIWNTAMSSSSMIRKVAMSAFFIHFGGQLASYKNIDRIFDGMYPIFYKDFQKNLALEEKEKEDQILPESLGKDHEITELMKEQVYNPERAYKRMEQKELYNEEI